MKKKIIIMSIALIVLIFVGIILASSLKKTEEEPTGLSKGDNSSMSQQNQAPNKVYAHEKEVSSKKQQELFNFIPKVYTEEIAPFSSTFMLDAVMKKIIDTNEEQDFSVSNVDNHVTRIFGEEAKINKDDVSEPEVGRSLFYYSKEAGSYAVIPVGYDGKFECQLLKNVTETDEAYYVYTYTLIGGYSYDESSINRDEFGDIDYENSKVQVIVGDKDGNDLVHIFDNYNAMYDENIWLDKYSNIMPIFRYTLTKKGNSYYLTEVEQINY